MKAEWSDLLKIGAKIYERIQSILCNFENKISGNYLYRYTNTIESISIGLVFGIEFSPTLPFLKPSPCPTPY
jgi:hypothetical protein